MNIVTPRVLLDTCAREHGILIGRGVGVPKSVQWGEHEITHDVAHVQGRKLDANAGWLREQIPHLAAIAGGAQAGRLERCTSNELRAEGPHRSGWSGLRGDFWKDVQCTDVPPPLERSTWMGSMSLKQYFDGEHQQAFCDRILIFEQKGVPPAFLEALGPDLDDFQRANLGRLGEYRALCDAVGPTLWRDAEVRSTRRVRRSGSGLATRRAGRNLPALTRT